MNRRWSRPRQRIVTLVMLVAMVAAASPVSLAQPATPATADSRCVVATEPNELPEDAIDLGSGTACATAGNPTGGQDLYRWEVTESEAEARWSFELSAIPGQIGLIEIYEVVIDEAGAISDATSLISAMGAASQPTIAANVLWRPGTYYIGIAASVIGPYTFAIIEGDSIPSHSESESILVEGAFNTAGIIAESPDAISWTVGEADIANHLDLQVQGPAGSLLNWTLSDVDELTLHTANVASDGIASMPDLGLEPGTYTIALDSPDEAPTPWIVGATLGSPRSDQVEDEPNETPANATELVFDGDSATVSGRLATAPPDNDRDYYRFIVDASHAGRFTNIRLIWQGDSRRQICLLDSSGAQLRCTDDENGLSLTDLVLPEGDFVLDVSGETNANDPYVLKVNVSGEAIEGFEAEPNDTMDQASPLMPDGESFVSAGRFQGNESDFFRFAVSGDPQLWVVEASGTGLSELALLDGNGQALTRSGLAEGSYYMYDAFLLPGEHGILLSGDSGDYTVNVTPLGPPDPRFEIEPNDSVDRSQPLTLLEERSGRLATRSDVDYYRFSLQGETYLNLRLDVPPESLMSLTLENDAAVIVDLGSREPGGGLSWDGLLPAGDYIVRLSPLTSSLEPYSLLLTQLDPFQTPDDLEPNDIESLAAPMPDSLRVSGALDVQDLAGDVDWYRIDPFNTATQAIVSYTPGVQIQMWSAGEGIDSSQQLTSIPGTEEGSLLVDIPAGAPILLEVRGQGPYDIAIAGAGVATMFVATPVAASATDFTATLNLGDTEPAAYWTTGQVVEGELTIVNDGVVDLDLNLASRTGNATWFVAIESETVTVGAGESVTIPVEVHLAPDAWADRPIFVAVEVADGERASSAMANVTPSRTAPPLNPEAWFPVPEGMFGGLNVAWTGLGATPVALDDAAAIAEAFLYDELLTTGQGVRVDAAMLPVEFTVDLAGDDPAPVAGIVLFPLGIDADSSNQLRGFELELSMDGQTFTPVLAGELSSQPAEQAFALDEPVEARFARLRVLSPQSPLASVVSIGEWKVVADSSWIPPGGASNLADPAIGGHLVDIQPPLGDARLLQLLLTPDGVRQTIEARAGGPVSWTIGFHHNRAARIERLEWRDPPDSDEAARFDSVTIEVSATSPIGPWTSLGAFPLERDSSGTATIDFAEPGWARFVRVNGVPDVTQVTGTPVPDSESVDWELPEQILIFEEPVGADYRSILGEWGTYNTDAVYEDLVEPERVTLDDDAGNTAGTATILPLGDSRTGSATVDADEDWYRVEIPEGDGSLTVTLYGVPALGVIATLFDEAGGEVRLDANPLAPNTVELTAIVEPGAIYRLRVSQPPTSVIFSFDTSQSIGTLDPTVYQGLTRFAGDVVQGRETVNILPFGEQLLLDDWVDEPYFLQSTIANYPRTSDSSDAEGAIVISNEALIERGGNRAIVLITDAENNPSLETMTALWPGLASTAPRIFAIGISGSTDAAHAQDLMQDWSLVNSGHYVYVRDQGEMDIAFDRAATELRRPSIYTISAQTAPPQPTPTVEPPATPEPAPTPAPVADGSLQVLAPSPVAGQPSTLPASQTGNVAIVLDTSGSMLQGLESSTRAEIAKAALIDLVANTIPAGTNVSLRTFGDTPDSCETILTVPPGPLDPAAMIEIIAALPIVNLVRTPLGASLEAVAGDLGTGEGPKIVVLVTDGEETCEGDPDAAIRALVASGIDVRVNIVGFAIDEPALAATFTEWAVLGNGQYIDAGNAAELDRAVAQAVAPTFDVLDATGAVVASGQVGADAIPLPPGTYQVVIRSSPEITIDNVTVTSGQPTEVTIPAP